MVRGASRGYLYRRDVPTGVPCGWAFRCPLSVVLSVSFVLVSSVLWVCRGGGGASVVRNRWRRREAVALNGRAKTEQVKHQWRLFWEGWKTPAPRSRSIGTGCNRVRGRDCGRRRHDGTPGLCGGKGLVLVFGDTSETARNRRISALFLSGVFPGRSEGVS